MPPIQVHPSTDADALGAALAAGFAADPMMRWIFADVADPARALVPWFALAAEVAVRREQAWAVSEDPGGSTSAGAVVGAALWSPPGVLDGFDEASSGPLVAVSTEVGGTAALERMAQVGPLMDEHHPSQPAWYLFITAVVPDRQGLGLGARLLEPVLRRADEEGHPCYLEASNPRGVPFYERLGFEVVSEFGPDGGPRLRGMWRPPADPA